MTWFNFPGWGDYNLNGVAEKELVSTGAHGYATQAQAVAQPNASPDAEQSALLQTFNAASLSPVGAGAVSGVLSTPHSTGGISGAASNIVSSSFGAFTQPTMWLRVGEVLLGIVLIAVGVARITKSVPVATHIAKKVGATGI